MKKTIGGDRLGAGNKMETELHEYNRSTHNLSETWRSSMACGTLVPFLVKPALNGDKFTINLEAMARTIPTQGPLMGDFKVQLDVFQCPMRLYQGLLHNNALNIGLNMDKVKLPQLRIKQYIDADDKNNWQLKPFANNCLLKYLGISGMGLIKNQEQAQISENYVERDFNAIPALAYYEIFKNYYANKQEDKAYYISGGLKEVDKPKIISTNGVQKYDEETYIEKKLFNFQSTFSLQGLNITKENINLVILKKINGVWEDLDVRYLKSWEDLGVIQEIQATSNDFLFLNRPATYLTEEQLKELRREEMGLSNYTTFAYRIGDMSAIDSDYDGTGSYALAYLLNETGRTETEIILKQFDLENIDTMRKRLLAYQIEGVPYYIDETEQLAPYADLVKTNEDVQTWNTYKMNGLCVKTYQADLFNAWVNTEWLDGENGISAITTIDTSDGLNLDALNLAQKVYNMLNRIAVSGGSYDDWQEAVYGEEAIRRAESPIYLGGLSSEIVFEEVVSSAASGNESLGTLAGKGRLVGKKGGYIEVKVNEPSFIMGIVSITPRVDYTQGNEWYMTELESMDDLHKPALDGIGFQNLMAEQAAYFGTTFEATEQEDQLMMKRQIIGKVPAWVNYMTSVNKAFGDFAEKEGLNFMVLARNYEVLENEDGDVMGVKDLTTYIDPQKFNYAFAYQNLDAQNFWMQIYSEIEARRIMSAKIIPNL